MTDPEDQFTEQKGAYPAPLNLNVEKYRSRVEKFDITEQQKGELLQTLWDIMRRLAEIGYGIDSVDRCIPALKEISSELARDALEQTENMATFNGAALDQPQGKEGGI